MRKIAQNRWKRCVKNEARLSGQASADRGADVVFGLLVIALPQILRSGPYYRSMLFVPGHKLDWMLKSPKYGADALIFDLEDSVEETQKSRAREAVASAITQLRRGSFGRFVRLNGWRTGHQLDDLNAIVVDGLDGVMLPKTEDPEDVAALDLVLGELERSRGLPLGRIEICPYAETARAMHHFYQICMASPRIKRGGTALGPTVGGDATRALGLRVKDDPDATIGFGAISVLQARAAGIAYIEGAMTAALSDLELVRQLAERSKQMGASWATAIHPTHIPILNEVYSPSRDEINEAREIVLAMAGAVARGDAAARHGTMMVDYASVRAAMDRLNMARSVGIDVGEVPQIELPGD